MEAEPRGAAVLTAGLHGNIHGLEHIFPVVLPMLMAEFSGSMALFGIVGTAAYLTMGLGGLPAGWLADRLGSRALLLLGAGICSAGCFAVAAAPSAGLVAAALSLLGVGLGLYHPAGLSLLSRTYVRFHGWSLGIHGMGGAAAIVVAPALFGGIAAAAGWRTAYVVAGILSLALGLGLLALPGTKGREAPASAPAKPSWSGILLLLAETACAGLVYRGVVTFLPMFYSGEVAPILPPSLADLLRRGSGSAAAAAAVGGALASITYASAILGQTLGGWAASSKRFPRLLVGIGIVFTLCLAGMGLASGFPVLGFGILFAAAYFAAQPITNMLVARWSKGSAHGMVYGVYFTTGFGIGALAPAIVAPLASGGPVSTIFLFLAVAGAGSVALRIAIMRRALREGA